MDGSSSASHVPLNSSILPASADHAADVNASKLVWSLVIGIVWIYKISNQYNPSDVNNMEMLLHDEWGDRIHGTVPKENYGKSLRTTGPKFKLTVYLKTCNAIGHVVSKEDVSDLVTRSRKESKVLAIYMEDLERNRMKCTIFGNMVGEALAILEKADG
ncbi:hypothetical protein PIB30_061634 [Stylosanthes scabra]|uniref:Uncharacterized protein n=1 Tax=Stylosanthes scabra TaxID=79078 RepID=A0ABU6UKE0_9FABA|nr:hypothetical protein [Stylosanthes scabra]